VNTQYNELVYNGFWFSPGREALEALVTEMQRDVAGVVRLRLYKDNTIVAGRKSAKSLYDPNVATIGTRYISIRSKRRHWIHSP
jgi:argininosuccinate synthase